MPKTISPRQLEAYAVGFLPCTQNTTVFVEHWWGSDSDIYKNGSKMEDHEHIWGELESSRFGGIIHRKCQVEDCKFINAYDADEDEEYEDTEDNMKKEFDMM